MRDCNGRGGANELEKTRIVKPMMMELDKNAQDEARIKVPGYFLASRRQKSGNVDAYIRTKVRCLPNILTFNRHEVGYMHL